MISRIFKALVRVSNKSRSLLFWMSQKPHPIIGDGDGDEHNDGDGDGDDGNDRFPQLIIDVCTFLFRLWLHPTVTTHA